MSGEPLTIDIQRPKTEKDDYSHSKVVIRPFQYTEPETKPGSADKSGNKSRESSDQLKIEEASGLILLLRKLASNPQEVK
jgi:hypothetical protein